MTHDIAEAPVIRNIEATTGVRALDAMRRGLIDEWAKDALPDEDLMNGLHLIEVLYKIRATPGFLPEVVA